MRPRADVGHPKYGALEHASSLAHNSGVNQTKLPNPDARTIRMAGARGIVFRYSHVTKTYRAIMTRPPLLEAEAATKREAYNALMKEWHFHALAKKIRARANKKSPAR